VRSKILNESNIQKLAELINQELKSSSQGLRRNLEAIDKESKEIGVRLSRLYDAIETAKVSLEDLAPRIKELREQQKELNKSRVQVEANMISPSVCVSNNPRR
jgi:uncharacterized protein YoxC